MVHNLIQNHHRYMEQQGKLLSVSPLLLVSCDPLPEMAVFVLMPVVTYVRNKPLRRHVKKSLLEFRISHAMIKLIGDGSHSN